MLEQLVGDAAEEAGDQPKASLMTASTSVLEWVTAIEPPLLVVKQQVLGGAHLAVRIATIPVRILLSSFLHTGASPC
ncbi:MAG: hypothetical protein M3157_07115 [Actinomycetota bacterium]|nr:hypothetical protein [Actinomycetota bacterium]